MKTVRLYIDVKFDESKTNEDAIVDAFDTLIDNALSTPDILDEVGEIEVDSITY